MMDLRLVVDVVKKFGYNLMMGVLVFLNILK